MLIPTIALLPISSPCENRLSLTRYIIRRMLLQVFVLVGVSSLTFFMMIIMPGDPATILMETTGGISTDAVDKFRERWGFDKPAYMQYITFMSNLVRGDFGESFVTRKEIRTELASFLPATAELSVVAFLMAVIMAIPAGSSEPATPLPPLPVGTSSSRLGRMRPGLSRRYPGHPVADDASGRRRCRAR